MQRGDLFFLGGRSRFQLWLIALLLLLAILHESLSNFDVIFHSFAQSAVDCVSPLALGAVEQHLLYAFSNATDRSRKFFGPCCLITVNVKTSVSKSVIANFSICLLLPSTQNKHYSCIQNGKEISTVSLSCSLFLSLTNQ